MPANMTTLAAVTDDSIQSMLLDIAGFTETSYFNQFEFNLQFPDMGPLLKPKGDELYSKTRAFTRYMTFDVAGILDTFAALYNTGGNSAIFGYDNSDI